MKLARSERFVRDYAGLPAIVRKKIDRQILCLANNIRHPSLHAKKMDGEADLWEARIDYHHRLTFQIITEWIVLRRVGTHDILKKP